MKFTTGLVIGVLIAVVVCFGSDFFCNPPDPIPEIIIEIDTVRDTIYRDSIQYVDAVDGKPDIIPDTVIVYRDTLLLTDTVFVYDDYFVKYVYADTLKNDSSAFIFVRDTIYRNRLFNRYADIEVYNTHTTQIIPKNDRFVTLGAFFVSNPNVNSFGLKTGLENAKNDFEVGIGTNKTYLFTYGRKFELKPLKLKPWLKRSRRDSL
jgi:hypothetical protein